jgi:ParB/RepB/Spo0J family partition protein
MTAMRAEQISLFADIIPDGEPIRVQLAEIAADLPPNEELFGDYTTSFRLSIERHGIQIPILLRDSGCGDYRYKIIDGGRRVKAGRDIRYDTVEAIYYGEMDDATADAFALMVHGQRNENLLTDFVRIENLLERGATEAQIAAETGLSRQTIGKRMKVRGLITELRAAFLHGSIGGSVANACTKLTAAEQENVAERVKKGEKVRLKDIEEFRQSSVRQAATALSFIDIFNTPSIDDVLKLQSFTIQDIEDTLAIALERLGLTVEGENGVLVAKHQHGDESSSFTITVRQD